MAVIECNGEKFESVVLKSEKPVLVDFNATWCGPCRMLKPILEEYSETATIKVCSVDVDNNENLARTYNIYSIPCLILFENGKEIKRNVGLLSLEDLKEFVGE